MIKLILNFCWVISFAIILQFQVLFGQCDSSYTYIEDIPSTAVITAGDSCFYNGDLSVLDSLIILNGLDDETPLHVGNQLWFNGRLKSLTATFNPFGDGVNVQLEFLPENFGDLSELGMLFLEKNRLTSLPESFVELTNLFNLAISQNYLNVLPDNFGNLVNLYFLDLGYNQLPELPESFCSMVNLQYLWLFNNQLSALPDCFCELGLNWSGDDNSSNWYPFFGIGGNQFCGEILPCFETIDSEECGSNISHFLTSLDQNYYAYHILACQDCEYSTYDDLNRDCIWDVLDLVLTAQVILGHEEFDNSNQEENADLNDDDLLDILDIILMIHLIMNNSN